MLDPQPESVDIPHNIYAFFKGRGTVATGRVEQGTIKVGEEVEIMGLMQVKCGSC